MISSAGLVGLPVLYFLTASLAAASRSADHHLSESVRWAWLTPTTIRSVAVTARPSRTIVEYLVPFFSSVRRPGASCRVLRMPSASKMNAITVNCSSSTSVRFVAEVQEYCGFRSADVQDLRVVEPYRRIRRLDDKRGNLGDCGGEQRYQRCRKKGHPVSCPLE